VASAMTLRAGVLVGGLLCASSNLACGTSRNCTLEERAYSIEVARDLPVPFTDVATLSFELCVVLPGPSSQCRTAHAKSGAGGTYLDNIQGFVSQLPDGTAHVDARISITEQLPSSVTPVSFRVRNDNGTLVLEATGEVRWDDDSCHAHPLNTSF
jgi:hypothetical protein